MNRYFLKNLWLCGILALVACASPASPTTTSPAETPGDEATPTIAPATPTPPAPTATPPALPTLPVGVWPDGAVRKLPAPLYFLSETTLWRLETDGLTRTPITDTPIDSFDVSPATGQVAYISDAVLTISDAYGNNARVINTAGMRADGAPKTGTTLAWAPDGMKLAVTGHGIWLYDTVSESLTQWVAQPPDTFSFSVYPPHAWSPDGKGLLAGRMYADSDYGEFAYVALQGSEPEMTGASMCNHMSWSRDGQAVYAAMYLETALCPLPGVERLEVNGWGKTSLVSSVQGKEKMQAHFVDGVAEGQDGNLYYFYATAEAPADGAAATRYGALKMYRAAKETLAAPAPLRDDDHGFVEEILWADDRSLAVIVAQDDPFTQAGGKIILLTADNKPAVVLADQGARLRWGQKDTD